MYFIYTERTGHGSESNNVVSHQVTSLRQALLRQDMSLQFLLSEGSVVSLLSQSDMYDMHAMSWPSLLSVWLRFWRSTPWSYDLHIWYVHNVWPQNRCDAFPRLADFDLLASLFALLDSLRVLGHVRKWHMELNQSMTAGPPLLPCSPEDLTVCAMMWTVFWVLLLAIDEIWKLTCQLDGQMYNAHVLSSSLSSMKFSYLKI